jgi:hypothetical protein
MGSVLLAVAVAVGCSDPVPATPQLTGSVRLGPGLNSAAKCGLIQRDFLVFGKDGATATDGSTQADGTVVSVSCRVSAAGDNAFDVLATGSLASDSDATKAGSFSISGRFTNSGIQKNIRASFKVGQNSGFFEQNDCTVEFKPADVMGVAPGRIWGILTCPTMKNTEQGDRTCEGGSTFKFENCSQGT